jgi:hypothetical protein
MIGRGLFRLWTLTLEFLFHLWLIQTPLLLVALFFVPFWLLSMIRRALTSKNPEDIRRAAIIERIEASL